MSKKTLISLAVASSLGLTGCFDDGSEGQNAGPQYRIEDTTIDRSVVRPIFDPNPLSPTFSVPTHFDLLLLLGATQGANHDFTAPASGPEPVRSALDSLSGFSTTSAFNVRFDGELNPETVIKGQTVHLIALNTDAPLDSAPLALPAVSPADIAGIADGANQPNYRVDVVNVDGGTDNAIRITPLEPLEEKRKYLVLVGNSVKGANDKNIQQSVQGRNVGEGALANEALENVKSIVGGLNDLGRNILQSSGQDVALAYTFTTNADAEVLRTMFAPEISFEKLGQQIGFTAQLKAVRDVYTDLNFSELTEKLGELGEKAALVGAGDLDISTLPAKEQAVIARLGELGSITTGANIIGAIGAEVAAGNVHLPQPRPTYFFSPTDAQDLATVAGLGLQDSGNAIFVAAEEVQVSQGAITLPYYQSLPGEDGDGLVNGSWEGNVSLEEGLNEELDPDGGVFQFLRDGSGALNVNGNFPFAEQQATVTVPIVVFHPQPDGSGNRPATCMSTTQPNGVTIFQHGITTDRSAAMLPGILLAQATCQAIIAIDQPLHGLAGATAGTIAGLTPLDEDTLTTEVEAVLPAVSGTPLEALLTQMINADLIGERHFGFTRDEDADGIEATAEADIANIASGSLFVNPGNMLNSRDNLRQGVLDLINLVASVQTMDVNKDFAAAGDYFGLPVNFVGHSLGGISGATFASLVNNPTLNGALNDLWDSNPNLAPLTYPTLNSVVLHNTGGQVTRLLENSDSRSVELLASLADGGVTQKTSNFENFFYVFQSVVDGTDSVNFAMSLGNTTDNLLVTEVIGDSTVPNEANENPLGDAYPAPLAGTEPLMALLDLGQGGVELADGSEGLFLMDIDNPASKPMPAATFFAGANPCTEANHGTFVAPIAPVEGCTDGTANTSTAFSAMVSQTAGAISGAGIAGADAGDPTVAGAVSASLGISTTLANALDQDEAE